MQRLALGQRSQHQVQVIAPRSLGRGRGRERSARRRRAGQCGRQTRLRLGVERMGGAECLATDRQRALVVLARRDDVRRDRPAAWRRARARSPTPAPPGCRRAPGSSGLASPGVGREPAARPRRAWRPDRRACGRRHGGPARGFFPNRESALQQRQRPCWACPRRCRRPPGAPATARRTDDSDRRPVVDRDRPGLFPAGRRVIPESSVGPRQSVQRARHEIVRAAPYRAS